MMLHTPHEHYLLAQARIMEDAGAQTVYRSRFHMIMP
jgi:hypothetical protein